MSDEPEDFDTIEEAIANGGTVHGYRPGEVMDAIRRRALAAEEPPVGEMGEPMPTSGFRAGENP